MLERILRFSIEHRVARRAARARRAPRFGACVARAAADRRRAGHHEPPGADQRASRRRSRPIEVEKQVTFPLETALAGHPGPRVHALVLAQRLRAGDGRLPRRRRHLLRAPAGRASGWRRRATSLPAGRRDRAWARSRRARRDLHVDRRVRASARRRAPASRRRAGLAARRLVPDARGRAPARPTSSSPRYLRTVQDWIIRPQLKGVAGRRRRSTRSAAT